MKWDFYSFCQTVDMLVKCNNNNYYNEAEQFIVHQRSMSPPLFSVFYFYFFFYPNQIVQINVLTCTFPLRIRWENLIKGQSIFPLAAHFLILTTICLDNALTILGENWGWSLKSNQHLFSLQNIYQLSESLERSSIKFSQLILQGNVRRSVCGICMWILGLKGLIHWRTTLSNRCNKETKNWSS